MPHILPSQRCAKIRYGVALRDDMKLGDQVLFYHSNAEPSCIVGIAEVVREGYGDFTAWDKKSHYFDLASSPENPRWFMVDLKLVRIFSQPLSLEQLRPIAALKEMELLRKGSRLSVQPVRKVEFETILKLADAVGGDAKKVVKKKKK